MSKHVLLVDDERALRESIGRFLRSEGYEVTECADGSEALEQMSDGPAGVVLTDLRMPNVDGLQLLSRLRLQWPETSVVMMTAYGSVDSAVEALRLGAYDYILKPIILDDLAQKLSNLTRYRDAASELSHLRGEVQRRAGAEEDLVCDSRAMCELMELVPRIAANRSTVLLTGESGTGKEVFARAIHRASPQSDQPFLAVNVGAVPDNLLESQLFGHERGAFTGADRRRDGVFRAARGGTVFLDEIGELDIRLQPKLLRALEQREVLPVGSDVPVPVDVRVVAATNRDVEKMVDEGSFRPDLFYRLNVVRMRLPPLREHTEDIPGLVSLFVRRFSREFGRTIRGVDNETMPILMSHPWKGNVRELANVIERASLLGTDEWIRVADLPTDLRDVEPRPLDLRAAVVQFERQHIVWVLEEAEGSRARACELLGLSPATFYRRLAQCGLSGDRSRD